MFDQRIPLFHSIVSVEYFKEDGFLKSDEYVRMNYNGNALKIPSCQIAGNNWKGDGQFCTKKEFMRIVDEIIPKDFETECK